MKNIITKFILISFVLSCTIALHAEIINVYEYSNPLAGLSIQPTDASGNDLTQAAGTTVTLTKGAIISGQFTALFDSTGTGSVGPGGIAIFQDGGSPAADSIIRCDFSVPKAIQEVHVFTSWGDQRLYSWFVVEASTTGTNEADYTELGIATFGSLTDFASDYPSPGVCLARLYDDADGVLANNVTHLRLIGKPVGWGGHPGGAGKHEPTTSALAGCASYEIDVIGIPEPATLLISGLLFGLAFLRR